MEISQRLQHCLPPAVARIQEKAANLRSEDKRLVSLLRGEPDFDTPEHIKMAAWEALAGGETHYPPASGVLALREAISRRMQRDFGLQVDPQREILVTSGATEGIYLALQASLNPGDEVILFDPLYDAYHSPVLLAGGVPIRAPAVFQEGRFTISAEAIEQVLTSRTRAIILNNPWNPTGAVLNTSELEVIAEIASRHNLLLISDEIYEAIIFDGLKHRCLLTVSEEVRSRTVLVNSFSKTYAMTGWRLGYTIAPPSLTQAMLRISQQFSRSAATFVQHAGVAALDGPQSPVAHMVSSYTRRRDLVTRLLLEGGLHASPPQGTFFYFVDIRHLGISSDELANHLLEGAGVITVPGTAYGPSGEGFLRLSFAVSESDLVEGIDRIHAAVSKL